MMLIALLKTVYNIVKILYYLHYSFKNYVHTLHITMTQRPTSLHLLWLISVILIIVDLYVQIHTHMYKYCLCHTHSKCSLSELS